MKNWVRSIAVAAMLSAGAVSGAFAQAKAAPASGASGKDLLAKSGCLACHATDKKVVGPSDTARERLAAYSQIPIMKELGIAIDMGPWLGFLAPAGTPADVVAKLNTALDGAMADPQVKETMAKMSMVADRMSPQAYQTFYNNEFDRWGTYIRTANVKVDQ